jgi:N6-L-threonylcarbamoyladenine synthase
VTKAEKAVAQYGVKQLLLAGGVAANKGLRAALTEAFAKRDDIELVIPPLSFCTDNAAMIAAAGSIMFDKGKRAELSLNANPGLEIEKYND